MSGFFGDLFNGQGPTTTTTSSAGDFATPYWQQYLSGLNQTLGANPITPYGGPTVAPQNQMQQTANDMGYNLATGGSPAGNMANAAIIGQASGALNNPYATTLNPYLGTDPYTQQVINSTNSNMADAYQKGTAAQTAGAFNQAGAYGGSAYQDTMAQNNKAFANALGTTDSNLLNQNYYNNAQLAEDQLNRSTGALQNTYGNQLQAANLGLQSQYADWNAINGLNSLGTAQQGNTQNVLGAMQNYYTQQQQAPYLGYDLMGNALTNYSNANRQQIQQLPGQNPALALTGLIGAGATALNGFFPTTPTA